MNGVLDTLKILIEADASGLNTQLQKAGRNVQNFVKSMNSQEVNWQQILAGTISPAIISGVAATFAMALTSAISFQDSMVKAANNSSTAFSDNLAPAGKAALDIQAQTGQSATKVAAAMAYATKALGNYAAGQALVAEASKFALATGMDLTDIVEQMVPLFRQWGVTDATEIKNTMVQLFGVAAQGVLTIGDLTESLTKNGGFLKGKTTILEASSALQAFASQSGMTAASAKQAFDKVSEAVVDIKTQANLSAVGVGNMSKAIQDKGMAGALQQLQDGFGNLNTMTAQILGRNAGFDATTVANIQSAATGTNDISTASGLIAQNALIAGQNIQNNLGPLQKLQQIWGQIKTDIYEIIGAPLLKFFTGILEVLHLILNPMETLKKMAGDFANTKAFDFLTQAGSIGFTSMPVIGPLIQGLQSLFSKNSSKASSGQSDTSTTPAGTNNQTTVNNYNNNTIISSNAIGGGKGASSGDVAKSQYDAYYGYNGA